MLHCRQHYSSFNKGLECNGPISFAAKSEYVKLDNYFPKYQALSRLLILTTALAQYKKKQKATFFCAEDKLKFNTS